MTSTKNRIRVTKSQLIDIAINSIRSRGTLSMFREYVEAANRTGMLHMSVDEVEAFIDAHDSLIFGKGMRMHDEEASLPSSTMVYGKSYWRDGGVMDGGEIEAISKKRKDPSRLRALIPDYMDVMQPRPTFVYVIDDIKFWTLFKVVAVYRRSGQTRDTYQLFLVGKDRNTDQPFALGIPNGFIDKDFEACLRWTMDAHKGDVTIEV